MYLRERRRRRSSSAIRVLFLLLLISAGIYVYAMIRQEQIRSPFIPTDVPPTPTRSALSYAMEAESAYQQGRLAEATALYEQAVALEPDNVLFYIPLVRLLAIRGRTVEAVRLGQQATGMAPENARAWAVLGMAYDWNGDVPEAIDACKKAIELDPTSAEAYSYLAEAYADAGRWFEATDAAQTALRLDDWNVDVRRNYGYVLERQGNYWMAVAEYEKALEIHPNLAYIHITVGRNYRDGLGNYEKAIEHFRRAAEIEPENAQALSELGWTYHQAGEYERAQTYLKQATEVDPRYALAFGRLGINYYARRNYEEAIPNFERAIELSCIAARRRAETFYVTLENQGGEISSPSPDVMLRGDFVAVADNQDVLRATLAPRRNEAAWADARGVVTLDVLTGRYTLELTGLPRPRSDQVYVGWFEGVRALSGLPLSTGPLTVSGDGSVEAQLETGWVKGPRIEYFYTLGLAYFYMAQCEKSYPLFDAALQIDPDEYNALEGIRLCLEAGASTP
jgi:tetratricopeptide (TPR) repeat protein